MRKAARLFEIIQILRLSKHPVTAAKIAERLEVAPRSVYRDIAALQAMRVPIDGDRGVGYILRPGFTLPPLMFDIEETEAIVLALALLQRTGDGGLKRAASRAERKIAAALPAPFRESFAKGALFAWGAEAPSPDGIDLAEVRQAIRDEQKLVIGYRDEQGTASERTIQPLALIYYTQHATLVAWCELRQGFRSFRADRIAAGRRLDAWFRGEGDRLRRAWVESWKNEPSRDPVS